jgi:hypothetical protein
MREAILFKGSMSVKWEAAPGVRHSWMDLLAEDNCGVGLGKQVRARQEVISRGCQCVLIGATVEFIAYQLFWVRLACQG